MKGHWLAAAVAVAAVLLWGLVLVALEPRRSRVYLSSPWADSDVWRQP